MALKAEGHGIDPCSETHLRGLLVIQFSIADQVIYKLTNSRFVAAVLLMVTSLLMAWWWLSSSDSSDNARAGESPVTAPATLPVAQKPLPPAGEPQRLNLDEKVKKSDPNDALPRGVTAEQWAYLKSELKDHPNRTAEISRVASFMGFQADIKELRELRQSNPRDVRLQAMAQSIASELKPRLESREFTLGEALELYASLLTIIETDEKKRKPALDKWLSEHAAPAK